LTAADIISDIQNSCLWYALIRTSKMVILDIWNCYFRYPE